MANTFYKLTKSGTQTDLINKLISIKRQDCYDAVNSSSNDDLYALVSGLQKSRLNSGRMEINTLIKYYLLNQIIIDEGNISGRKELYLNTSNPDIKKDKKGNFYRVVDDNYEKDESILSVGEDGSYTVKEPNKDYQHTVIKTLSKEHKVIKIHVENSNGRIIDDVRQVAGLLNFRQEFQTKYKYSGVSGNSNDIMKKILNKFSKPLRTGYYVDFYCSAWKWSNATSSFNRVFAREDINKRPFSVDMEFLNDGTVLRQEYTGAGF